MAAKYQVRPELLAALIQQESGGNPNAVSNKGARGLAQVMPSTGLNPGFGVSPLRDNSPDEQKRFASDYLGAMLDRYDGDESKALAAYNAGPGAVDKAGGVPQFRETQNYVQKIGAMLNPISSANASEEPWQPEAPLSLEEFVAQRRQQQAQPQTPHPSESPLSLEEFVAQRRQQPPQTQQPPENDRSATSRLLLGLGGNVLDAASNAAELIPGVSEDNAINRAAQRGLAQATGTAGEIGKFAGKMAPYMVMPQSIPAAIALSTGIGALTSDGGLEERAIGAGASGLGAGIGAAVPKVIGAIGRGLGKTIGEFGTHTGGDTIIDAARAGIKGGSKQKAFTDYLRGKEPLSAIVDVAEQGKKGVQSAQKDAYLNSITPLFQDRTVLNYAPIEDALIEASRIGTYQGHVVKPSAVNVANKLKPIIDEWSGKPIPVGSPYRSPDTGAWVQETRPGFSPSESHTIEGLDALKKRVGDLYESVDDGTPEKAVLNTVYGKVKEAIETQSPRYKDIMVKDQEFRGLIKELDKELGLASKSTDSTALRKLLAIPRNNANTNYGNRVALADLLEEHGANNLKTMLNGAALDSFKPRGLGGLVGSGTLGGAAGLGLMGNVPGALSLGLLTTSQSPRLMGELALKTGQLSKGMKGPYKQLGKPAITGLLQALKDDKGDKQRAKP